MSRNSESRIQIGLGLLFTVGFPTLMLSRLENEVVGVGHLIVYETIWWAAVAAVILYALFAKRRPLSSVGYRWPGIRDIGIAIAVSILLITGLAFIYCVILPALHLNENQQVSKLLALPLWWRLFLVIRGLVAEELFYRGYAIERLQELTRSRAIAGIFACAVFTLDTLTHRRADRDDATTALHVLQRRLCCDEYAAEVDVDHAIHLFQRRHRCLASMGVGMELRHLRYFVAVAEAGSLTVAAEQLLHTSQPSLSGQIRDLEGEVGAQLLTRRARGIELTPAGRAFLDHARVVLSQVEAAAEAARRIAHPTKRCFSMGFLTGHELTWMPEALRILHNELPTST